jgi:hypothetical protein
VGVNGIPKRRCNPPLYCSFGSKFFTHLFLSFQLVLFQYWEETYSIFLGPPL